MNLLSLSGALLLGVRKMVDRQNLEKQLEFLKQVLGLIEKSDANPDVIYPLLQQNLTLLDEQLTDVLKSWVSEKFAEIDREAPKSIAEDLSAFGNVIQQSPLGQAIDVLKTWVSDKFGDTSKSIAEDLGTFGELIQQSPL